MKLSGRTARTAVRRARPADVRALDSTATRARSARPARERSLVVVPNERGAVADLLHAKPAISVDESAILHALSFAFVAGSAGGALTSALGRTALAASSFTPEALQEGLFLDELVAVAFDFPLAGKPAPIDRALLRRLLTRPPRERADVELRQGVLKELIDSTELRDALARTYAAVAGLPGLLDDEGSDARLDLNQWRLDVLRAVRDAVRTLDPVFERSHSALARLFAFGERVRATQGYQQLEALLDFEEDSARADLQVRLGADGRIRSLAIVSLRERRASLFYVHPVVRFFRKLRAFFQGYTLGANEIVDRWLETVWDGVREHVPGLLQLKGELEFYLGSLHFKRVSESQGLSVCLPTLLTGSAHAHAKHVHGLWNPLLLGQGCTPVATDLNLPSFVYTCITTGPNSGGKTRFLQALALCQLLGQSGGFVAARAANLRLVSGMFVSLGEAPHADQKEGRLGMELTRIRALFEHAQGGSLVVLDELCSGTNPSEGEEIFRMLLELLHELEHEVHITTHFLNFAHGLQGEALPLGLSFLQVELDGAERPTYRFIPGVATTSLAQQTAERLGVTREQLRELIRRSSS